MLDAILFLKGGRVMSYFMSSEKDFDAVAEAVKSSCERGNVDRAIGFWNEMYGYLLNYVSDYGWQPYAIWLRDRLEDLNNDCNLGQEDLLRRLFSM